MPKYRTLTKDELKELEGIFINFLAAKSIPAGEWEKIKKNDKEKMNELIEEFSDVVFEKTLSNVKLLEKRTPSKILLYAPGDEGIELLGLEVQGDAGIDFTKEFTTSDILALFDENNDAEVSFIMGTKPYFEDKKKEIFDLMQSGAMISPNVELMDFFRKLKENYG